MSKIATLKSLPTPSELRQNVAELQQTAQQLQSLDQLPNLVAQEVSRSLAPLLMLQGEVERVLMRYEEIMQVQRNSLEQMATELGDRSAASMEQKAGALDTTLQELASQVQELKSSMASVEASSKGMQALPKKLASAATEAANEMQSSSQELARQAERVRPSAWLVLGQMAGAAMLGALFVVGGQAGLSRLLPPSETQQQAQWAAAVWSKATEQERKLLSQIASRPAK